MDTKGFVYRLRTEAFITGENRESRAEPGAVGGMTVFAEENAGGEETRGTL